MAAKAPIFLQFLFIFHHFNFSSSSTDTITINQTIKDGNFLISQKNLFTLGFFSPGKSTSRCLGIWFRNIPKQTIVWVANRNNPINDSSGTLTIDHQTGNLLLSATKSDQKVTVWSTNVSAENWDHSDTFSAQLLDSGNLVLIKNGSGVITWQSFDYPGNIMLQGMKIGVNKITGFSQCLSSWISPDNPGIGDFSYRINPNGSPQLFLHNRKDRVYWRSGSWPWRSYAEVYNYSFVNNEKEAYFSFFIDYKSVILILLIDESGILRRLTWHENEGQWKEFWSAPKHRCDTYGQCGSNSLCDPYNFTSFECGCLPGFEPKSPRDWKLRDGSGGCVRKRMKNSSVCGDGEGFVRMASVKIPESSGAVWVSLSMGREDCENVCRNNCSCTAYSSVPISGAASGCLVWFDELMDTIDHSDYGYDLYVRVDSTELAEDAKRSYRLVKTKRLLFILIVTVASAWLIIFILAYFWLRSRRRGQKKKMRRRIEPISGDYKDSLNPNEIDENKTNQELAFLSLHSILVATNNLSPTNKIGQGGFGSVYKGKLANGEEIAVKRLCKSSGQGRQEFKNEVMLIAKLQHRNLVKLVGCCNEGEERILIYEYLPNGSLDTFLFDETRNSTLDWSTRFKITIGIARGILYLHQDSRLRIIHRDLKSSNILLDEEMNPKISDFGLARIFKGDQTNYKTNRVVGTYGYMSPEYAVFGKFSVKSDVFSFGVIVLEIVSGKKAHSFIEEDPSLSLIGHVWELWKEDRAMEIIESSLKHSCNSEEALRCIQVGLLCVQEDAFDRPNMADVTLMLSSQTSLPRPKQPAFILRRSSSSSNSSSSIPHRRSCSINDLTMTAVYSR